MKAQPTDLVLIVDRDETSASFYLSLRANLLGPVTGADPSLLFSQDGKVPIEQFRQAGSFELADQLFAHVTGHQGGTPITFEAMSLMVHPATTPLPFSTPWEGVTAISVCSVDYNEDQPEPAGLQLYHGGFTDQISGSGPLAIRFPKTGRDPLSLTLHRFEEGVLVGSDILTLHDGGSVSTGTGPILKQAGALPGPVGWLSFMAVLILGYRALRHGRKRQQALPIGR